MLLKGLILAVLALLACIEKLGWIMNTLAVERDWVRVPRFGLEHEVDCCPLGRCDRGSGDKWFYSSRLQTLTANLMTSIKMPQISALTQVHHPGLNSQMRRIDLFCKLMGPLVISLVDGLATDIAISCTFGLSVVSVGIEYFAISQVFGIVRPLRPALILRSGLLSGIFPPIPSYHKPQKYFELWGFEPPNNKSASEPSNDVISRDFCRDYVVLPPQRFSTINGSQLFISHSPLICWANGHVPAVSRIHLNTNRNHEDCIGGIRDVSYLGGTCTDDENWCSKDRPVVDQLADFLHRCSSHTLFDDPAAIHCCRRVDCRSDWKPHRALGI
jgi:Ferroportin1 (FPN1)